MVFRIFAAALAAGLLSAILITALQSVTIIPLIHEAETFEVAAPTHDHTATTEHDHSESEWMPAEGMERMLYTLLANFGAAVGFSLLLIAGLTFDLPSLSARRGVLWGLAGFGVFTISPALGLPPGIPGLAAPDEQAAQLWWLATVVLSAAGLGCLVFGKTIAFKAPGLVLLALPHLWGAPPVISESLVPAYMAARFSAMSIVLGGVFWVLIGTFSSLIFARLGEASGSNQDT
ncbi:MAG: CbtA family protein [Rhodospirillaceae bacterium]|nr:CbtA family protein [Rhodospirillaceae bacterium]MBL6931189.1 CbtA family protein [Rhodospirillales bacterium]MBL6942298.1 CbtA family protein [Rhodospirillales bacterium]